MTGDRFEDRRGREAEDPGIPRIRTGRNVRAGLLERRLLHEAHDARRGRRRVAIDRRAAFEIAESRLGVRRAQAEGDEHAFAGECRCALDRGAERRDVLDQVVGGHREEHGIAAVLRRDDTRGERDGRRGVAAEGLEQQRVAAGLVALERRIHVARVEVEIAVRHRDNVGDTGKGASAGRRLAEERLAIGKPHEPLRRHFA